MIGSIGSVVVRSLLVVGALALPGAAVADEGRAAPCIFDEDCPVGAYCGMNELCAAPQPFGAVCDRHAMCASGLCADEHCGALTIDTPVDGVATRQPKLVVRGRAPVGAVVHVSCGPVTDVVASNDNGQWLWVPGVQLSDGTHTIGASVGLASASVVVHVDTTRPALRVDSPWRGAVTAESWVDVRGHVELGARLAVSVDGQLPLVQVDPHGDWALRVQLAHGAHRVQVSAADAVGNETLEVIDFAIDLQAPFITIDDPRDGGVFDAAPERLRGRAEPGTAVYVSGPDANVWLVVPDSGQWSWLLPDLADGVHVYGVEAFDRMGWSSTDRVTVVIDGLAPELALDQPGVDAVVASPRPVLGGAADPESVVVVAIDGQRAGSVRVGANARWSLPVAVDLAEGAHAVVVTATDRGRNTSRFETTLTVDLTAPALSFLVPERELGADVRVVGHTEALASLELRLDGLLVATAIASARGDWSVTFAAPYAGEHTLSILARDRVGRVTEGTTTLADPVDGLVSAGGGCAASGSGVSGLLVFVALVLALGLRRRHHA